MTNSKVRERLAAAVPFRSVRQPRASEISFPSIYGWDSVPGAQSVAGSGGSSAVGQVLQATLKEASTAVTQANKQLTDLQTVQQQLLVSSGQNIAWSGESVGRSLASLE